jgi:hypothetical protein
LLSFACLAFGCLFTAGLFSVFLFFEGHSFAALAFAFLFSDGFSSVFSPLPLLLLIKFLQVADFSLFSLCGLLASSLFNSRG